MQLAWEGYYEDGKHPVRCPIQVRLDPHGLQFTTEHGEHHAWPYADLQQTQGFHRGDPIRLERGTGLSAAIIIADPAFLQTLHKLTPTDLKHSQGAAIGALSDQSPLLVAVVVIVIVAALFRWGIPALAGVATPLVPTSWEEGLGQGVIAKLAPPDQVCTFPPGQQAIEDILHRLTAAAESPYTFQVVVVDTPEVNALAAPGGYIAVHRGLLEQTKNAEELAGVLAHEVQHVVQRHATRSILQDNALGLLLTILGRNGIASVVGTGTAQMFTSFQYSRWHEEEADHKGLELLIAAGIDPTGMITFYEETLAARDGEKGTHPTYLSTHPNTAQRVASLKAFAAKTPSHFKKLLSEHSWNEVRYMCQIAAAIKRQLSNNSRTDFLIYSLPNFFI